MRLYEFATSSATCPDCGDQLSEHGKRDIPAHVCKSPKHLGRSDQSQCVAKGLRPHHTHKTIAGEKIYGKKEPHRIYGGKKINTPLE